MLVASSTLTVHFKHLILGHASRILESHDFENLREDILAGFVDADSNERQLSGAEIAVATVANWPMAALDPKPVDP